MNVDPFHLNQPVHLARRDVFYEQAHRLVEQIPTHKDPAEQHETAEKALAFLKNARHHAKEADQSQATGNDNQLFSEFLDAAVDNTQSITRMLRRQRAVESENSTVIRFLNSEDTASKMSTHYRRCAAHILKGLLHLLSQAEKPYQQLKKSTFENMTPENRVRYEKTRKHLMNQERS